MASCLTNARSCFQVSSVGSWTEHRKLPVACSTATWLTETMLPPSLTHFMESYNMAASDEAWTIWMSYMRCFLLSCSVWTSWHSSFMDQHGTMAISEVSLCLIQSIYYRTEGGPVLSMRLDARIIWVMRDQPRIIRLSAEQVGIFQGMPPQGWVFIFDRSQNPPRSILHLSDRFRIQLTCMVRPFRVGQGK